MSDSNIYSEAYEGISDAVNELEQRGIQPTLGWMHDNTLRMVHKSAVELGYWYHGKPNRILGVEFMGTKSIPEELIIVFDEKKVKMHPEAMAVAWVELEDSDE